MLWRLSTRLRRVLSPSLEQLLQDLRAGARIVTGSPGLTAAAVTLMALVIGGNTTVFTVVHGILTKPAAGVTAANLVTFNWTSPRWIEPGTNYATYQELAARSTRLERIAAVQTERLTIATRDASDAAWGAMITPNYFSTFGAPIIKGRSITVSDNEVAPAGLVAVISHNYWERVFAGAADVIGRKIHVNGQAATIVGVTAPPFRGGRLFPPLDIWVPVVSFSRATGRSASLNDRGDVRLEMVAQLPPGVDRPHAEAEMSTVWSQLKAAHPELGTGFDLQLLPYSATAGGNSAISTQSETFLGIFSVLTAITLVVVCANVANLLVARAVTRQRELALRQSLGASRFRIVRLLLAEGLAIALLAWACAVAFAWWFCRWLVGIVAPTAEGVGLVDISPDWTVASYALLLALVGVLASSLAPLVRVWSQPLLPSLKSGEQGIVRGRSRLSKALVVMQLAFSILLLVTAGLAYRSLSLLGGTDLGYQTRGLLLATVRTGGTADTTTAAASLLDDIRQRIATVPDVAAVSYGSSAPREFWSREAIAVDGTDSPVISELTYIGPGYFETIGLPLVVGNDFAVTGQPATAIVTDGLAETLWPGRAPLGQTIVLGRSGITATVIGVARDAYYGGFRRNPRPPLVMLPFGERPEGQMETTFYIRHMGPVDAIVPAIRRAVRDADIGVPVVSIQTLENQLEGTLYPIHLVTTLLTLFGLGSLAIATLGQYASVSFEMKRRVREVGVRMAMGASAAQVLRGVLTDGLRSTAAGLLVGFTLSAGLATALAGVLYGITPTDGVTYAGVFLLLTASSLTACLVPARRAARQDPIRALRYE